MQYEIEQAWKKVVMYIMFYQNIFNGFLCPLVSTLVFAKILFELFENCVYITEFDWTP